MKTNAAIFFLRIGKLQMNTFLFWGSVLFKEQSTAVAPIFFQYRLLFAVTVQLSMQKSAKELVSV